MHIFWFVSFAITYPMMRITLREFKIYGQKKLTDLIPDQLFNMFRNKLSQNAIPWAKTRPTNVQKKKKITTRNVISFTCWKLLSFEIWFLGPLGEKFYNPKSLFRINKYPHIITAISNYCTALNPINKAFSVTSCIRKNCPRK